MKKNIMQKIGAVLCAVCIVAAFAGCVSANTDKTPGAPAFVVSPSLTNAQSEVHQYAPIISGVASSLYTPAAVAAPFVPSVADTLMAIMLAASGWYATRKNSQAMAAQASSDTHQAAAAALASALTAVNSATVPAIQTALSHAAQNRSVGAVAQHLADAGNPVQL